MAASQLFLPASHFSSFQSKLNNSSRDGFPKVAVLMKNLKTAILRSWRPNNTPRISITCSFPSHPHTLTLIAYSGFPALWTPNLWVWGQTSSTQEGWILRTSKDWKTYWYKQGSFIVDTLLSSLVSSPNTFPKRHWILDIPIMCGTHLALSGLHMSSHELLSSHGNIRFSPVWSFSSPSPQASQLQMWPRYASNKEGEWNRVCKSRGEKTEPKRGERINCWTRSQT